MEAILLLEEEIADELVTLSETKKTVKNAIQKLDDERHRALLEWYYIVGKTLAETADELGYSERWAYCLHAEALEKVKDIMVVQGRTVL